MVKATVSDWQLVAGSNDTIDEVRRMRGRGADDHHPQRSQLIAQRVEAILAGSKHFDCATHAGQPSVDEASYGCKALTVVPGRLLCGTEATVVWV